MRSFMKWVTICALGGFILLFSFAYSQVTYPYVSGQVVFVQSPYNSSLYTNYNYRPHDSAPQRLPPYTTNQAVFVGQSYATAPQTVTSYPTTYADALPYTSNRYTSPAAYPSTTAPAYPYGTVGGVVASPYSTTSQTTSYRYPYYAKDYTSTYTYPYTTSVNETPYPPTTVERVSPSYTTPSQTIVFGSGSAATSTPTVQQLAPAYTVDALEQGRLTTTYNAYPITTDIRYPYPLTTTAVPETIVQPAPPAVRAH